MAIGRTNAVVGANLKIGDVTHENKASDPKFLRCDGRAVSSMASKDNFNQLYDMCSEKSYEIAGELSYVGYSNLIGFKDLWICAGTDGQVFSSTDLTNWTPRLKLLETTEFSVENGAVYTKKSSNGLCYRTTDGVNWTALNINFNQEGVRFYKIIYVNGLWNLVVAPRTTCNFTSTDGINFVRRLPFSKDYSVVVRDILYKDGLWALGGFNETGTAASPTFYFYYFTSTNGIDWVNRSNLLGGSSGREDGLIWLIGGNFVIQYYNKLYYSADGLTWTNTYVPSGPYIYGFHEGVQHNDTLFMIGCDNYYVSSNGKNWEIIEEKIVEHSRGGTIYGHGFYVFRSKTNTYKISKDGYRWEILGFPDGVVIYGWIYNDKQFIGKNSFGNLAKINLKAKTPVFYNTAYMKISE